MHEGVDGDAVRSVDRGEPAVVVPPRRVVGAAGAVGDGADGGERVERRPLHHPALRVGRHEPHRPVRRPPCARRGVGHVPRGAGLLAPVEHRLERGARGGSDARLRRGGCGEEEGGEEGGRQEHGHDFCAAARAGGEAGPSADSPMPPPDSRRS